MTQPHTYNGPYTEDYLNRIAFPMGGIGAGMICLEGTGALSHVSLRHKPDVFHWDYFNWCAVGILRGRFLGLDIRGLARNLQFANGLGVF